MVAAVEGCLHFGARPRTRDGFGPGALVSRPIGATPAVQDESHFLVRHLGLLEAYASCWSDGAVRRLMKELGPHLERALMLARADITTKHAHKRQRSHERLHELAERAEDMAARDAFVPPLPKGLGDALMRRIRTRQAAFAS